MKTRAIMNLCSILAIGAIIGTSTWAFAYDAESHIGAECMPVGTAHTDTYYYSSGIVANESTSVTRAYTCPTSGGGAGSGVPTAYPTDTYTWVAFAADNNDGEDVECQMWARASSVGSFSWSGWDSTSIASGMESLLGSGTFIVEGSKGLHCLLPPKDAGRSGIHYYFIKDSSGNYL